MQVVSACALPVASLVWPRGNGRWALTAVCRATIWLHPGESVLADHQEAPVEDDDHWDDDPARSLRIASDLVPTKPAADVTIVGHAFAPQGHPARSVIAHLSVGELNKSIEVVADRWFDAEGTLREGPRFTRMPLVYERAAGGPGTPNPVGIDGSIDAYGCIALPNLQAPNAAITSPRDFIAPVGFGPVAPNWPNRVERLGRTLLSRSPPALSFPLPDDFDARFFNHAPRDQQVSLLREQEQLVLENLHPDHARFVTRLPAVRPIATVERSSGTEALALQCDTLWIDTDRLACTLTWRATVALSAPEEAGRVVFSLDEAPSGRRHERHTTLQLAPGDAASDPERAPEPLVLGGPRSEGSTLSRSALPFNLAANATGADGVDRGAPVARPAARMSGASDSVLPFVPASPHPHASEEVANAPAPRPSAPSYAGTPFVEPAAALPPLPRVPRPSAAAGDAIHVFKAAGDPPASPAWWLPEAKPGGLTIGQRTAQPPPVVPPPKAVVSATPAAAAAQAPAPAAEAKPAPPAANPAAPSVEARPIATGETPKSAPQPASAPEQRIAYQLVDFDPESLPRIRRKPAFVPILQRIEERPLDAELEDPATAKDPASVEDRRDVFEVLACGEPLDETGLEDALDRAVRDDGKFVPPFVAVAGDLRFAFEELAVLRATIAVASPFAPGNPELEAALVEARELAATGDAMAPPGLADRLTARVGDAFRKVRGRLAPNNLLDDHVARVVLERRLYQRREVFGAPHVRAFLTFKKSGTAWPVYLREATARKLPLFARFPARLLADAHVQEDQFEPHPYALRVQALVRVVQLPGAKRKRTPSSAAGAD